MRFPRNNALWPSALGVTPLASTASASLFLALCALVTGPMAARVLGAEGRGALAAVQAWPLLLATLGSFGLSEAAAYFAARSPVRARPVLFTGLLLSVPFVVMATLGGFWIIPRALGARMAGLHSTALICLVLVPLLTLAWMPYQAVRGAGHYRAWNILRLIAPVGWLGTLVALESSGRSGVTTVALGFVAATAVQAAASHLYAWRSLRGNWAPDRQLVRPMLAYGGPTMLTSMPQWLNFRVDQLILILFLDTRAIGLYVVAVAWAAAAQPLASVLAHLAVPTLAGAKDAEQDARRLFNAGIATSIVAALFLAALTPLLLPLVFGMEFREAVPAGVVMALAGGIVGINAIGAECLRGMGRARAPLVAECVGLAVTCTSLPILIPIGGIVGAAVASVASYGFVFVVQRRLMFSNEAIALATVGSVLPAEAPPR